MDSTRRTIIRGAMAAGVAMGASALAGPSSARGAKGRQFKKIAVEEGFMIPELGKAFQGLIASGMGERAGIPYMEKFYKDLTGKWTERGLEMGEARIREMDAHGVDMQVLSLSAGGISWYEAGLATELAALCNDRLAVAVAAHPDRFAGLAAVAPQNPEAAARELKRGVTELGFKGAIINSNVQGAYLDDQKYWPIFQAAEALGAPIYLHPSLPAPSMQEPYRDYALIGPMAGFSAETSLHTLRLIMSGLFDTFPKLHIVLGHLGEGIPFFLDRIDRAATNTINHRAPKLGKLPSAYFHENFSITTSGMNSPKVVDFCMDVLGPDKVMFAIDYPYEEMAPDVTALDSMDRPRKEMEKLFHGNAERVFKLN